MKTFKRHLPLFCLSLLAAVFSGCTTIPETNRSALQFSFLEAELASSASSQFAQMKEKVPVSTDPQLNARVEQIGVKIVEAALSRGADLPPIEQWEFVVFENEQANAFAMPGGKIGVYTGIIELFGNDAQMAAVMGHEVAHVVAGHGNERVSQQLAIAGGGLLLGIGMRNSDADMQRAVLLAYGLGAEIGLALPYSRTHEKEADYIGLLYMAQAGYDPREAVEFWREMSRQGGAAPPEFLSTHPAHETRIERLQEAMPDAMAIYRQQTGQ